MVQRPGLYAEQSGDFGVGNALLQLNVQHFAVLRIKQAQNRHRLYAVLEECVENGQRFFGFFLLTASASSYIWKSGSGAVITATSSLVITSSE